MILLNDVYDVGNRYILPINTRDSRTRVMFLGHTVSVITRDRPNYRDRLGRYGLEATPIDHSMNLGSLFIDNWFYAPHIGDGSIGYKGEDFAIYWQQNGNCYLVEEYQSMTVFKAFCLFMVGRATLME